MRPSPAIPNGCGSATATSTPVPGCPGSISPAHRLHLALTLKDEGNVLLLDEPTNDVDVNTIRALEEGLDGFAGCAVVVSHDRWFLDRIATHILAFEGDSQVVFFDGNYSEYEANKKMRLGDVEPKRFKYKKLME